MNVIWFDHLFFAIIGIILPLMAFLAERPGEVETEDYHVHLPPKKHIYYTNGLMLVIGALIVLTLWNVTFRSFEVLGITYPVVDTTVIVLCVIIVLIYAGDTIFNYISSKKTRESIKELGHIMPTSWNDYSHFIFLAFAAGICEEIVFRGFMINYVKEMLIDNAYAAFVALVLPSVIFSVSHIYQGWFSVLKIFSLSLLFGAIFMYSGSLLLVIIIHVLVDLISGAAMVKLAGKQQ